MSEPHALIAGAGIGGLSAALCLARAGWRVSIFESAPAFEEVGAGLQLSPNASAILEKLNVVERLRGSSLAPHSIRVRRARDGATLALMPMADAERRWGAPYLLTHRADLQRALLQAAAREDAIRIHGGVAVAGFASGADGVVAAPAPGPAAARGDGRLPDRRRWSALPYPRKAARRRRRFAGCHAAHRLARAHRRRSRPG